MDETSQPIELLVSVSRDGAGTLTAQIEDQLRSNIRDGTLKPGARVPSTRDLAQQVGVSRRIAVDAYSQLAAEGYLELRQGARPKVAATVPVAEPALSDGAAPAAPRPPLYDFRPSHPDVSTFPRTIWLRSLRDALTSLPDSDLGYADSRGVEELRIALADYLGRVRGVVADADRVLITCGYTQGQDVLCRALVAAGAKAIAHEDPGDPERTLIAHRAGLKTIPIPVDEHGMRIDELARSGADAVFLTPAHHFPTGALMSGERRNELVDWLRDNDTIAVEDDYDAEYRYDRAAVGALQGREPDRVVYAGTASKTLAPALRIGWFVLPPSMVEGVGHEKRLTDRGTARIEQHAFADFLNRGELDRHLRRMRVRYRERRDAMIEALGRELPEAKVRGIAAGLHVTAELPDDYDEDAILAEAQRRRLHFECMGQYRMNHTGPPALLLGYAQLTEAAIAKGVAEVAAAVRASRSS